MSIGKTTILGLGDENAPAGAFPEATRLEIVDRS